MSLLAMCLNFSHRARQAMVLVEEQHICLERLLLGIFRTLKLLVLLFTPQSFRSQSPKRWRMRNAIYKKALFAVVMPHDNDLCGISNIPTLPPFFLAPPRIIIAATCHAAPPGFFIIKKLVGSQKTLDPHF